MYVFCDFVVIPVVSQLANHNKAGCLKLILCCFSVCFFVYLYSNVSFSRFHVYFIFIRIYHECEGTIEKSIQRLAE